MKKLFILLVFSFILMSSCTRKERGPVEVYNVEFKTQHWYNRAQLVSGQDTFIVKNNHGVPLYKQVRSYWAKYRNIISTHKDLVKVDTAYVWYRNRIPLR